MADVKVPWEDGTTRLVPQFTALLTDQKSIVYAYSDTEYVYRLSVSPTTYSWNDSAGFSPCRFAKKAYILEEFDPKHQIKMPFSWTWARVKFSHSPDYSMMLIRSTNAYTSDFELKASHQQDSQAGRYSYPAKDVEIMELYPDIEVSARS